MAALTATSQCRLGHRMKTQCLSTLAILILSSASLQPLVAAQIPPRKNVLIITELGETHPAMATITRELTEGLSGNRNYQIEIYVESMDTETFSTEESQREFTEWITHKYRDLRPDVVVAVGPAPTVYLAGSGQSLFPNTSIVLCGAVQEMAGSPQLDPRFTGTWLHLDIGKTVDLALRLLPQTSHIAVVAGASPFDKAGVAVAKTAMKAYERNYDVSYLTDLPMDDLLARLQHLPDHTIILYTSFFRDAADVAFVNATSALPMVSKAAIAPVFGMSDSYLGHGVVGGYLMSFAEQGRIATRIVSAILDGKKPNEIPISTAPNMYMFDWKELRRWKLKESALPTGSVVYFREWSFWERTWWIWIISLSIMLALAVLAAYLFQSRRQLKLARDGQLQLSGLLINAQEKERSRLASELHDDFSQRLALLALGLENVAESIPPSLLDANRQLHELLNSTSELGADLHTLSHQLHSSSLESLGLLPAVTALCKEFAAQHGIKIDFTHDGVPLGLNSNVALCLFRIIQEGLRNVMKYAGVKEAEVSLGRANHRLEVLVRDKGSGFDLKDLRHNEGLGIRSMAERARLVGGGFKIHSAPGRGTAIEVWVPFEAKGIPRNVYPGDGPARN